MFVKCLFGVFDLNKYVVFFMEDRVDEFVEFVVFGGVGGLSFDVS